MRKRIKYKNIFGVGFVVPAFTLAAVCNADAQECAALPTCEEFGYLYTAEECAGQKYVKCPFDQTKYFCLEDSNSSGNCPNPQVGDILYSDMSCSADVVSGKTPIGLVFNADKRLAIALKTEEKAWSTDYFDVPELTNYSSKDSAKADWAGKSNTSKVINYCSGNSKSCPAFDYVKNYSTMGTQMGDWYLPALGEVNAIYSNKGALNVVLNKIGGMTLVGSFYWSSSELDGRNAWELHLDDGYIGGNYKDGYYNYGYVRPVLAF